MIDKNNYMEIVIDSCPSFKEVYNALDDEEKGIHYSIASAFANHLMSLFKQDKTEEFEHVGNMIERLHTDGDDYIKELATIGFLEDIQNVWGRIEGEDQEYFKKWLQPISLKYWESLNKFWSGDIPCVGADIGDDTTA